MAFVPMIVSNMYFEKWDWEIGKFQKFPNSTAKILPAKTFPDSE